MSTFLSVIHVLVCSLLCAIILMQKGRGGGLTESFAAAESMFGAKTNAFMVKTTTVLASLFLVTCLSFAYLSSRQNRSLMENTRMGKENPMQHKGLPLKPMSSNVVVNPSPDKP